MSLPPRGLARRYAAALHREASARGGTETAAVQLESACGALKGVADRFRDPRLSLERRREILKGLLAGRADGPTARLLGLLVEKRRLELLDCLSAEFRAIMDEAGGRARATVRCAARPSPARLESLRARLCAVSGKEVLLEVREDPGLLAGVEVRMGDKVYDGSLSGRLGRLKERMAGS